YQNGFKGGDLVVDTQIARNILTYLIAEAIETLLRSRGLTAKPLSYSRRKIWFPAESLIRANKHNLSEPGRRRVPISLVGSLHHRKKEYTWHFAVQPTIDLHVHHGLLLNPKVLLAKPYVTARGEKPILVDDLKALKKVNWWNKEWRQKLLALIQWLSNGSNEI